jgi:PAS domain-containing protein
MFTVIVCTTWTTMSTSPDFAEPAAPTSGQTDGNVASANETGAPFERLHVLPALVLLDRLPVALLATGLDGVVIYNNPAFASTLGYHPDTITLIGRRLPALLAGRSSTPPRDCVTALRAAGTLIVDWLHAKGFPIRSVVSDMLFVRGIDQVLLIGVTDITELEWTIPPQSTGAAPQQ